VRHGGGAGEADDADGVAGEHVLTEGTVAWGCVGVAVGAACPVGGGPAGGALAGALVKVGAAGFGADTPGHRGFLRGVVPSRGSAHRCPCGGVRVGASGTASMGAGKGGVRVRGAGCARPRAVHGAGGGPGGDDTPAAWPAGVVIWGPYRMWGRSKPRTVTTPRITRV